MEALPEELVSAVSERRAILFAGAGLSMSVGLPSWQEFVARLREELDLTPEEGTGSAVSHHTLAEYYRIKQGSIGPLRSWMDRHWRVSEERLRKSKVHQLVVALDFPIIYTTNYDSNIEAAFNVFGRAYVKVANVRDIAKTREGVPQIVKFHGDFDDDDSLVITETDYFNRLSFDTPLDIKFRSDALSKTVLFIGYSMSDLNIRLLLHSLWRTWRLSGFQNDRPRSFIFMGEKDRMQQALLEQWGIEALTTDTEDREQALISFLEGLRAAAGERPQSQPERKRKQKPATRVRG